MRNNVILKITVKKYKGRMKLKLIQQHYFTVDE